jgi:hypothetical protein
MDLKEFLTPETTAIFLLANLVLFLVLTIASIAQARNIKKFKQRWSILLSGPDVKNFEHVFHDLMQSKEIVESEIQWLKSHTRLLDQRLNGVIQNVGYVRFDAFQDVGGEQSFALALCDEHKNGILLTCLIGRSDCRVYCKPISSGKCDRQLNTEEAQAIEFAFQSKLEDGKKLEPALDVTKILK